MFQESKKYRGHEKSRRRVTAVLSIYPHISCTRLVTALPVHLSEAASLLSVRRNKRSIVNYGLTGDLELLVSQVHCRIYLELLVSIYKSLSLLYIIKTKLSACPHCTVICFASQLLAHAAFEMGMVPTHRRY